MAYKLLGSYSAGKERKEFINFGYNDYARNFTDEVELIADVYIDQQTNINDFRTDLKVDVRIVGTTTDLDYRAYIPIDRSKIFVQIFDNDNDEFLFNVISNSSGNRYFDLAKDGEDFRRINKNIASGAYTNRLSHNFDGTKSIKVKMTGYNGKFLTCHIADRNDDAFALAYDRTYEQAVEFIIDLPPITRATKITTASNFTDIEEPQFTYTTPISHANSTVTSIQACLSLDGVTDDIPYREISSTGSEYLFSLTEEERELLRSRVINSSTAPIYYITKTVCSNGMETYTAYDKVERVLSITSCYPQLNSTVKDIKPETLALTGDENTFVRYESMAEYAINATPSKYATIVSQYVQCGSKKIENLPNGVIDDVESADFTFYVLDSRNMQAQSLVSKNVIEYVKPTCYQKLDIGISGETGAEINLTISGSYFNGSFGAANNEYLFEVRYTDDNGEMGEWIPISATPQFNGNTYELTTTFSGFNYGKAYVFQSRLTDKLNVVESSQYTIRMLPVFDWSENDFNFNVPVNINADDFNMNGQTIIRHSDSTGNTVLSADGNIYIRPSGTNSTYGETIFYSNGNVKFNGTVTFADGTTGGGASDPTDSFADYVIETGEEAMGSNGTWYWRKWNSGKAEAWGCRNFGNAAVTTAWGNLYRSAIFTQDLPNNVFIRTPDAININIVHSNFGGWICKHEQTAPSADTTGSFIFVRPASATVTPTNIGFHIIGEWK